MVKGSYNWTDENDNILTDEYNNNLEFSVRGDILVTNLISYNYKIDNNVVRYKTSKGYYAHYKWRNEFSNIITDEFNNDIEFFIIGDKIIDVPIVPIVTNKANAKLGAFDLVTGRFN